MLNLLAVLNLIFTGITFALSLYAYMEDHMASSFNWFMLHLMNLILAGIVTALILAS